MKNKKNKSMRIIICLIKFSYFQNIYYLWKIFSQRNSKYFYSEYKIWILLFFSQLKMKTQNLSLKSIAVEKIVVSDSSAHGIKNVFKNTNWFVKIFWMVMFLTSSSVAVYCKFSFHFQKTLKKVEEFPTGNLS